MKKYFKFALAVFLCVNIFFVSAYFYLEKSLENNEKTADNKADNIPYYEKPESRGILFEFPNEIRMLFFLDFEKEMLYIINIYDDYIKSDNYVGYPADYYCKMDYYTLSSLFDRLGGIDFESEEGIYRLSGIQVCDLLCENDSDDFYHKIICGFCKRVSETGISDDDLLFLISGCDTDLTMPVCLYWSSYMNKMFANAVFVNRGN